MYQTSNEYKSKIYDLKHLLKVYINNIEIDDNYILGCNITQELFSDDEFILGSTPSKCIELKLYKEALPNTIESIYIASGITGEIIPIGFFNVDGISKEDNYTVTLKLIDDMIKFEFNYDGSELTYPCTLMTILQDICLKAGVELGSTSFLNQNKQVAVYDNTVSARTYLSYISEQAGGFACIGRDGKLYIKTIGAETAELPINYFQNFKWGNKFKISRIRYEDGIQVFEAGNTTENTVYINQDNMYIVDQEQIDNIYNSLNGLEVYSFEGNSIIDPALDIGDLLLIDNKYVIYQGTSQYNGRFKASISNKIQCKEKEETTIRTPSQKTINRRVESRINQVEGVIETTVEEVNEQNQKIAKITQDVDEIKSEIQDIADVTTSKETTTASLDIEDINESEPVRIVIHPIGTNISYLYPSIGLFPSSTTFLKVRTLRFHNTTTGENFDYELPNDLLYYDAEHYDEFILDYEGQSCVVNKRVGYNADGTTYVLASERTIEYEYPSIELTEGDYTISLLGYNNAYIFARMMIKNLYTDQFATKAQLNSAVTQTKSEVDLSVNQKLTNYSTTSEMNSAINVKANQITLGVSETYETKSNASKKYSEIKSTTDGISLRVSTTEENIGDLQESSIAEVDVEYALSTSTSTAPTTGWSTVAPTWEQGKYMWQRTKITYADGTEEISATTCIAGATGQQGIQGIQGERGEQGIQGNGIQSTTISYGISSSSSTMPSSWSSSIPTTISDGDYLWTRTVIDYTDTSMQDTVTYTYSRQGVKGDTGTAGTSVTVSSIQYQEGTSATTAPTGTWSNSVVSVAPGKYLWTKTTFSNGSIAYGVAKQGENGTNGTNGQTTYFHIKYSAVANPTSSSQMSEVPNVYIGTYVDFTQADSTNPSDYTWARFQGLQGEQGDQGIPGQNGQDGQTYYLHIKYSNDGGTTFTSNAGETPGAYIGVLTNTTQQDSTTPSDYTWSQILGDEGVGVNTFTPLYYLSTSNTTAPTLPTQHVTDNTGNAGRWTKKMPTWESGKYYWTTTEMLYTDNSYHWTPAVIETGLNQANSKVEGKLDEEDFTGANIMLAVNSDSSSATINANKISLARKNNKYDK